MAIQDVSLCPPVLLFPLPEPDMIRLLHSSIHKDTPGNEAAWLPPMAFSFSRSHAV